MYIDGAQKGCKAQLMAHLKFGIVSLGVYPAPLVLVHGVLSLCVGGAECAIIQHVAILHQAALGRESGQRDRAGPLAQQIGDGDSCACSIMQVRFQKSKCTKQERK
jgi:hypothetical protein